jgi:hypothetical protein
MRYDGFGRLSRPLNGVDYTLHALQDWRGASGCFAEAIRVGGPIPSPCIMLIMSDLHLNVPVGNNRSNNISGCVRAGPAKLLNSMR